MADNTGAPHFIPYVEPTDLVREYPAADEASAFAVAAALDGIPVLAGIGSNVVQAVKTNTFTTSSQTFNAVPGLSVTITPSSVTSRVLVYTFFNWGGSGIDNASAHYRLVGGNLNFIGDASGNRVRASASTGITGANHNLFRAHVSHNIMVMDSPATTSPVTYSLEMRRGTTGEFRINFGGPAADSDNETAARTASSIIAIEVAA